MHKIAISGKANSGKNTVARLLVKELKKKEAISCEYLSFADPIKKIAQIMFPNLPEKYLNGPSAFRSEAIQLATFKGIPLTVRQLLMNIGTEARNYNEDIWVNVFENTFKNMSVKQNNMVIVTDVRFRNEFDRLKSLNFYKIRVLRESCSHINHISETDQESIRDNEFDYILVNNGTIVDLQKEIAKIALLLQ